MNDESVIFVGGVKACFTHQEISDYFSQFGKVSSIKMKKNRKQKEMNRGFCLVKFLLISSAQKAIQNKNHLIEGRLVTCRAYLKGENLKVCQVEKNSKKLYLNQLPLATQNIDIIKAFSKFGQIESGYTLKEENSNLSKGFGFVTFETKEAADLAIKANGKVTLFGTVIEITLFANMPSAKDISEEKNPKTYSTDSPSGSDNSKVTP
jgi:heterogeneous nuclear ribonucleoprotein A1/A3